MIRNTNLEVSFKPFYGLDEATAKQVCLNALRQWDPVIRGSETTSVLLWASDGSEILDYDGQPSTLIEWARYLGDANAEVFNDAPPPSANPVLHRKRRLYKEGTGQITYGQLAETVRIWKEAAAEAGLPPLRVGIPFDPGGEFAPSAFKYERHREICLADTRGPASFVCCYATLHGDERPYAGFPQGIPEGTSLGTFLGRQAAHFCRDLGFDFIWLSNGFGFGMETWKTVGPLFDGTTFTKGEAPRLRDKILGFWRDLRRECPDIGIETRGTNLGTGTDLASDGTPLRELYAGDFNFEPPPNSPWASLDGDFGVEIMGYLTRIVELPADKKPLFRFYVHDPWWINSPWLDRYQRNPHDIYMPLSVAAIDDHGHPVTPERLSFLTIDDSFGRMPESCPTELTPHLLRSWQERPDEAGPLVWVYPFEELHEAVLSRESRQERAFHTDWFIREAFNEGVPINTVISTRAFLALATDGFAALRGRVLISPTPIFESRYTKELLRFADEGGKVLFYGPIEEGGDELLDRLRLEKASGLDGRYSVERSIPGIDVLQRSAPSTVTHEPVASAGPLREAFLADAPRGLKFAEAVQGRQRRALGALSAPTSTGGRLAWLRGPLALSVTPERPLPMAQDASESYALNTLVREAVAELGWSVAFEKTSATRRSPVLTMSRHTNAFLFSTYLPDSTAGLRLRTPMGAPLLVGLDTDLRDGASTYHLQRASRYECRVFVEQTSGTVSCTERPPVMVNIDRRLCLEGLQNATVRFFGVPGAREPKLQNVHFSMAFNTPEDADAGMMPYRVVDSPFGEYLELTGVDDTLMISW